MEDLYMAEEDRHDLEQERYVLAVERIREIPTEQACGEKLQKSEKSDFWEKYNCNWKAGVLWLQETKDGGAERQDDENHKSRRFSKDFRKNYSFGKEDE